jgi:16S rRNA (uracil1498-N3)-methyltransferase
MSARLFVDVPEGALAAGTELDLPREAAHHALGVLRSREGDTLVLFDGRGGEWPSTIVAAGRRDARVRIERHDAIERESPLAVTLAVSLLASDAMDSAIRKSVELGVAVIQPVAATRSQGPTRRAESVERWRRLAIAACEQCGRNRIPAIEAARPLAEWLAARGRSRVGFVFVPGAAALPGSLAATAVDVLVGPEGGWTGDEIAAAQRAGLTSASMGPRVLRADTACVAALALVQAAAGGFR